MSKVRKMRLSYTKGVNKIGVWGKIIISRFLCEICELCGLVDLLVRLARRIQVD